MTDPSPEKIPLTMTISRGSLEESFLVQLFSIPHRMQASRTKRDPKLNCRLEMSSKDKRAQDAVTNRIPSHSLAEIASLKIISAMIAVATISKLFSREAFA